MCGRFTLTLDPGELQALLDLGPFVHIVKPRYNIAPSQPIPIVKHPEKREVELYKWGLVPSWADDPKIGYRMINARSETAHEKPSFRAAFTRRRCLILADGFFEWHADQKGAQKTPYLFKLKNDHPFTFAGLYEHWQAPQGGELHTCTILTCSPNDLVKDYHNRMPVMLGEEARWQWLLEDANEKALLDMLIPYPAEEMKCYPVSKAVNSPENDRPDVLEPMK
ncbi:MAG: SOS response-associated peptidase [Brevefilum sp.]|nr:SOS response-associated peptidase [Brevefilum sp.]MDT8382554.1 SOS response-associated peptidase [Brevefilum sp.]MDW7755165.1 SOS response-associated peptidase [Brevefilum sp.]